MAAIPLNGDLQAAEAAAALARVWTQTVRGEPSARSCWEVDQGGVWTWQQEGVSVSGGDTEWVSLSWRRADAQTLRRLKNFVVGVTLCGEAEAAGFSFGHFKDFLAEVSGAGSRRLQLEVDVEAGRWAFRVDGQLQPRRWWDADVRGVEDLLEGGLAFKARHAAQLSFQDLAVGTFEASCRLSVIITCNRFLQRLRLALRNWCHQTLPSGCFEVLVVNPESPDGTHEHLAAVTRSYPHVRIRELPVAREVRMNKGVMVNTAVKASCGEWIWLTDADCLFAPSAGEQALACTGARRDRLYYGRRYFLPPSQTDALLAGRLDGLRDFDALRGGPFQRGPEDEPWGYTQIVHRSVLERIPYPERINHFAHSDNIFQQKCQRHRIQLAQVEGLFCLHLDHPFAWFGTEVFL